MVKHDPIWVPTDLRHNAAGDTRPGFICIHELENGSGPCGSNVFKLEDAIGRHACVTSTPTNPVRESVTEAMENDRCGLCGSVDHFREDHTGPAYPERVAMRDRASRATEGPWEVAEEIDGMRAGRRTIVKAGSPPAGRGSPLRVVTVDQTRDHHDNGRGGVAEANIEFIAHARTDIPELLDELDLASRLAFQSGFEVARLAPFEHKVRGFEKRIQQLEAILAERDGPEPWPLNVLCPLCEAIPRVWCRSVVGHEIGHVHDERREAARLEAALAQQEVAW